MMSVIKTHTGKIFVDKEKKLEFLMVGDYGKEKNIKANFLGLTEEINGVKHEDVDLHHKWVTTISTQHGCPMSCKFCDCTKVGFEGSVSYDNLEYQVEQILIDGTEVQGVKSTARFNVHYARMGEPSFNEEVLEFTRTGLRLLVAKYIKADTVHPVISTMLPKGNKNLLKFLLEWCRIKNIDYKGEAGLQFSINSTDDAQRNEQFNNMSLSLAEISDIAKQLPMPVGRKYTLNFAVTEDTILDVHDLNRLFNKDKFIVKITPIHKTKAAMDNGFDITTEYERFDVYSTFEKPLVEYGWDVIVFVPSEEEDNDRITCGNALISNMKV